jgi:hypothetical protein
MQIDLIVFTSSGRERYLSKSVPLYSSLLASIPTNRRILSVDGEIDSSVLRQFEGHFE